MLFLRMQCLYSVEYRKNENETENSDSSHDLLPHFLSIGIRIQTVLPTLIGEFFLPRGLLTRNQSGLLREVGHVRLQQSLLLAEWLGGRELIQSRCVCR